MKGRCGTCSFCFLWDCSEQTEQRDCVPHRTVTHSLCSFCLDARGPWMIGSVNPLLHTRTNSTQDNPAPRLGVQQQNKHHSISGPGGSFLDSLGPQQEEEDLKPVGVGLGVSYQRKALVNTGEQNWLGNIETHTHTQRDRRRSGQWHIHTTKQSRDPARPHTDSQILDTGSAAMLTSFICLNRRRLNQTYFWKWRVTVPCDFLICFLWGGDVQILRSITLQLIKGSRGDVKLRLHTS